MPLGRTRPALRVVRRGELAPAVARARAERSVRRVLVMLTASVSALTILGMVMVLSSSSVEAFTEKGSSFWFFQRQLLYAITGAIAATVTARVAYRVWQRAWIPLMLLSIALLVLVLNPSVGTSVAGSARWIDVGAFTIQPSELAKFAMVAATATILTRHARHLEDSMRWMVSIVPLLALLAGLIMLQPDLGTTMILVGTVFVMLFVAGVRLRVLAVSTFVGVAAGALLIWGETYRRVRFLSFLNPWADPKNGGYQLIQSLIALGSGHLVGVGLGASRQKWQYVPNAHTDFIFSILGEELGLIGELVVLALFAVVIYAGIRIAMRAPDTFGRLLAGGITGWIGVQAILNLGAVTGVLPITGVPLPFISFGGSALVVLLAAVGVLISVGRAGLTHAGRSASTSDRTTTRSRQTGARRGSASIGGASATREAASREPATGRAVPDRRRTDAAPEPDRANRTQASGKRTASGDRRRRSRTTIAGAARTGRRATGEPTTKTAHGARAGGGGRASVPSARRREASLGSPPVRGPASRPRQATPIDIDL
jgi:cell division protein FtsW